MKTKNIIIIAVLLILVGGGVATVINNKKKSQEEIQLVVQTNASIAVSVAQAQFENISTYYVANGTFEPFQELNFSSEISGKIAQVLVDKGSYVHVGQTLAIIQQDQRNIGLSTAQASYQNALVDNQRYENAFKTGGITKQQLDMSRLQLKNAKAQFDLAKINLGDTNVKATIDGIVNAKYIEPGSVVGPGTPLFEIVNVSSLKLKVEVDENHIINMKTGDVIKVKTSVFPDKTFVGKITFIAPKARMSLNFPVEIQVSNSQNELKAGMYGTAVFSDSEDESEKKPVFVIPRDAFVGGLENNQVFVVKNDIAKLIKVVSGRNFGDKIEILSGLKASDIVVTSGQINLSDDAKVTILK
ncbi:MAG: efflux RND transporter periplasmic adaptor subunit [Flavobacteriaceae bacterium]|jgi:RND family efflux transporter MFP subunit|nr:efflux RND transporter periplasmic adaptor subunit [Flavobacteriaceae bacterium]